MIVNKYPYTDFHELNQDWILKQIAELDHRVDTLQDTTLALAKEYTDQAVAGFEVRVTEAVQEVYAVKMQCEIIAQSLRTENEQFQRQVNAQLQLFNQRIDAIRAEINADIIGVNARTDLAIQQNNEYLIDLFSEGIGELKVTNFFTGDKISVQQMFDYLASLHVDDGITYEEASQRLKTYAEVSLINETYTNFILHGNTLLM